MSLTKNEKLLWVDVETTGLDPAADTLLEIGAIVTDTALNEIERASWVIASNRDSLPDLHMDVLEMHVKSGLWRETQTRSISKGDAEQELKKLIHRHFPAIKVSLHGSSVHFDLSFLSRLHTIAPLLSHRVVDVSTLKQFALDQFGIVTPEHGTKAHRALPDIEASIADYSFIIRGLTRRGGHSEADVPGARIGDEHFFNTIKEPSPAREELPVDAFGVVR